MVKIKQFEIAIEYKEAEQELENQRAELESIMWKSITPIQMIGLIEDFVGVTQERMVVRRVEE